MEKTIKPAINTDRLVNNSSKKFEVVLEELSPIRKAKEILFHNQYKISPEQKNMASCGDGRNDLECYSNVEVPPARRFGGTAEDIFVVAYTLDNLGVDYTSQDLQEIVLEFLGNKPEKFNVHTDSHATHGHIDELNLNIAKKGCGYLGLINNSYKTYGLQESAVVKGFEAIKNIVDNGIKNEFGSITKGQVTEYHGDHEESFCLIIRGTEDFGVYSNVKEKGIQAFIFHEGLTQMAVREYTEIINNKYNKGLNIDDLQKNLSLGFEIHFNETLDALSQKLKRDLPIVVANYKTNKLTEKQKYIFPTIN